MSYPVGSAELAGVLERGSARFWYEGDLWYDGQRRLAGVPLAHPRLDEDDSRIVKSQGSCSIAWSDPMGKSILPREIGDIFSPFGSELALYARIQVGQFIERVPMGWYQIVDVPQMRDNTMLWRGRTITTGSRLDLKLMDRMVQVTNDEFDVPTAPTTLSSVMDESRRITGLQISKSIPDGPISRAVAYKDSKGQAVLDLADIIGGVPYITRDGALSWRPKAWPAATATLKRGDSGTITDIEKGMSADGVYNKVVFRGQGAQQDQVLATSEVTSGPLRTANADGSRSPAHKRPTFRSNQFINTNAQALAYTNSELVRVRTLNAAKWVLTTFWDPRLELGQVLNVIDEQGETVLVRVIGISRDGGATQRVTVSRG